MNRYDLQKFNDKFLDGNDQGEYQIIMEGKKELNTESTEIDDFQVYTELSDPELNYGMALISGELKGEYIFRDTETADSGNDYFIKKFSRVIENPSITPETNINAVVDVENSDYRVANGEVLYWVELVLTVAVEGATVENNSEFEESIGFDEAEEYEIEAKKEESIEDVSNESGEDLLYVDSGDDEKNIEEDDEDEVINQYDQEVGQDDDQELEQYVNKGRREQAPFLKMYVVQKGETLYEIAQKFTTTAEELKEANDIKEPEMIFAGQKLFIPRNK